MKKSFLFLLMAFMMSWGTFKAQAGGSDYIIMLDNGSSTDDQSFLEMKRGAVKLIEQLLMCNLKNRVAVVHYGAGKYGDTSGVYKPVIYIESDFTSDHAVAQMIERRLDFGDHFNEALGFTSNALDGLSSPSIISPQATLNGYQPLKVVVFTDAERNTGALNGSYLVNYADTTLNSPAAFKNVLAFKINRGAQFTMIHANTNTLAVRAAASISSTGGLYGGALETNVADPDYGILPRLYYNRPNGFGMSSFETDYWKDMVGHLCNSSGWATMDFKYEPGQCISGPAIINGSYNLPAGAVFEDLRLFIENIVTGELYPVLFTTTITGSNFSSALQTSDFVYAVSAGATGQYKLKTLLVYAYGGDHYNTYSYNNYPYFDYDIDMDCPVLKSAPKTLGREAFFKLTPNPTTGLFKVILNNAPKSAKLNVMDLAGNSVYSKVLGNEKEIDIDISSRKEGVYIVNILNDKNETYSEKIIKK
ncbi:T9SS type A sorting domain-containing protein [Chryseobacterium vrystaatense]|uniref:Por secretion system C-terminal sorting domain-containing protein n=1 Tax=Chryseobacterium vrystaatense TaxID=307480 RepID=A0A1M5B5K9_9FLAO|nr:T9SS type A sorting domain-containing protein [Chryseobacterium vrystaatense]SHF37769.1 Por secretion system C-terminal sorting domain-containing protein [Chryseobacterium vrystaatense]